MQGVIVSVSRPGGEQFDLELPADLPATQLIPLIITGLGWQAPGDSRPEACTLVAQPPGRALRPDETLAEAGAWDGAALTVLAGYRHPAGGPTPAATHHPVNPAPLPPSGVPAGFRLVIAGGSAMQPGRSPIAWEITRTPWSIGRRDKDRAPSTDLADMCGQRIHRDQCNVTFDASAPAWLLTRVGATVGCQVLRQGERPKALSPQETTALEPGDLIDLAGGLIQLRFEQRQ